MSNISKVILFHGLWENENNSWFPWLKCELNKKWIPCFVPSLPSSNRPNFQEQLDYVMNTYQYLLDENTVLIWHSLWAVLIKHFLLQSKKKIKKIILVWPAFDQQPIDHLLQNKHINKWISYIQEYISNTIDENIVKDLTSRYFVYISKDDPYVLFDYAQKYFTDLNVSIREFETKWHFSGLNWNLFEFEELLEDII